MYELTPPLCPYPYTQYQDDDNINALFIAAKATLQDYVDFFNNYNLGDFYNTYLTGELLDWCLNGVYGIARPFLVVGVTYGPGGPYGLSEYGTVAYGMYVPPPPSPGSTYSSVNDDVYRRVATWAVYKGDGKIFNIKWLKRRLKRFLTGIANPEDTTDISVTFGAGNAVTVEIPSSYDLAATLQALFSSNILAVPFQYAFTINLV